MIFDNPFIAQKNDQNPYNDRRQDENSFSDNCILELDIKFLQLILTMSRYES